MFTNPIRWRIGFVPFIMHINASLMPVLVHPASLRHALPICKLEMQCFGWMRLLFGLWQRVGQREVTAWIAYNDGRAAGYLIAYPREIDGEPVAYVGGVGVAPGAQRRGIGRELMLCCMDQFPRVWLHVREPNTPAVRMYESLQFSVRERISGFYQNGDDALIMASWQR